MTTIDPSILIDRRSLPLATATEVGAVRVGDGLEVSADGTVSLAKEYDLSDAVVEFYQDDGKMAIFSITNVFIASEVDGKVPYCLASASAGTRPGDFVGYADNYGVVGGLPVKPSDTILFSALQGHSWTSLTIAILDQAGTALSDAVTIAVTGGGGRIGTPPHGGAPF